MKCKECGHQLIEFKIRTPDLSGYVFGPDPDKLADTYYEGFNPPQKLNDSGEWKLMEKVSGRWT